MQLTQELLRYRRSGVVRNVVDVGDVTRDFCHVGQRVLHERAVEDVHHAEHPDGERHDDEGDLQALQQILLEIVATSLS